MSHVNVINPFRFDILFTLYLTTRKMHYQYPLVDLVSSSLRLVISSAGNIWKKETASWQSYAIRFGIHLKYLPSFANISSRTTAHKKESGLLLLSWLHHSLFFFVLAIIATRKSKWANNMHVHCNFLLIQREQTTLAYLPGKKWEWLCWISFE